MKPGIQNFALASLPMWLAFGCAATGGQADPQAPNKNRGPVFEAHITASGGTYDHEFDGSILEDDTSASFVGLIVEGNSRSGFGGGLSLEIMGSDDNLFEDQGAPAQAATLEFAPFFLYRVRAGERFRMPVRVGPWIHVLTLDDQASSDSLDWVSYGLRAAVEPEIAVVHSPNFDLTLFAGLSLAAGATTIQEDFSGIDETYDSTSTAFGFELGPRFRWTHFFAGISYLHRGLSVDESEFVNNFAIRAIDTSYDGIAVTFGGGF